MSDSLWPHGLQHTRPPCLSPTPGACSNSYPSSQWCHPTISSSVIPFSSCLQPFLNLSQIFENPLSINFSVKFFWLCHLFLLGQLAAFRDIYWELYACMLSCSVMSDSVTPWTLALQAPLFMKFSRPEYWRGLPFPPSWDLPDPGIEGGFFTTEPPTKPHWQL